MTEEEKRTEEAPSEDEKILLTLIEDEMKQSYVDYAMSVIIGRALPDVRDGLKPVHRRILFAMNEMGLTYKKQFRKCARIVGETLGKFHPHGDSAVYDALVRMAQDFSLRYPLVSGQGNFGSVDGDNAAAMRYTEAKLAKISDELLTDIDKETVNFVDNFDGSMKEPEVLPSKIPNLLINGTAGIAVGMATNIPPHNIKEICDAVIEVIDNPDLTHKGVMDLVSGPDFPTGGYIVGTNGIKAAYGTGHGKIKVRGRTELEDKKKLTIIITEIPYMVNKSMLIEEIADNIRNKTITGISDLRDESDRTGMRIVLELKRDANPDVVLNQLYKHSRLQTTFGINLLALADGMPKVMNLKEIIDEFIKHRIDVVTRRTGFDLKKAEQRAHILEGLIIALDQIDKVIVLIKKSKSAEEARNALIENFKLTQVQAQAILDMRLQKLTSLEQDKIREEHKSLLELIIDLKDILASNQRVLDIIKEELSSINERYGDKRKTEILLGEEDDLDIEDLIEPEDVVVTISHTGYIKRTSLDLYKQQRRGGKGIIASTTKDEDFIEHLFVANTLDFILFFTSSGKVQWLKVYKIPEASRYTAGKAIINLLDLPIEEKVTAYIKIKEFDDQHYLIMATRNGIVKKTNLKAYSRPRAGGIIALTLDENDKLINVALTNGEKHILLATKLGQAVKFKEIDARSIGRTSRGVRGIRLRKGDELVSMVIADEDMTILTITENGYGKRTKVPEYRLINRGGVGVRNIICSERNGPVVDVKSVSDEDQIMFISKNGVIIRTATKDISVIGRNTQGMRLMRLNSGDKVVAAAKVVMSDHPLETEIDPEKPLAEKPEKNMLLIDNESKDRNHNEVTKKPLTPPKEHIAKTPSTEPVKQDIEKEVKEITEEKEGYI